jgi:hypothetical protein
MGFLRELAVYILLSSVGPLWHEGWLSLEVGCSAPPILLEFRCWNHTHWGERGE